jgi:hypothetical protein
MKKFSKIAISTVLALLMILPILIIPTTTAKNLNLPEGADRIDYYNAGGQVDVSLPTPLPANFPASATAMQLRFCHFETPNADQSFDNLIIYIYMTYKGKTDWQPFVEYTTSEDSAVFERAFWSGTFMEWDATKFGLSASLSADNIIVVPEGTLTVDRHGNDVTVNLNAQQEAKIAGTVNTKIIIPSFNLELTNYGESIHYTGSKLMTGWPFASGYTIVHEELRFNAEGTITSVWYPNGAATTNSHLVMHGTHTFYPPAA